MANLWELPTSINVNNHEYAIRTDYRAVLDVLTALSDKEMQGDSQAETNYIYAMLMIEIMVIDCDSVPIEEYQEVIEKLSDFIDMGIEPDDKKSPRIMDWEQDATLIIPAVNRVVGKEIRAEQYMHWWTFLSAYMEIGDCSFSNILEIRKKKAHGKKLEKWEQEYIRENKNIVLLREKLTDEEKAERKKEEEALNDLFG